MTYKEFLEYLETHLGEYNTFIRKATQYQRDKNAKRPAKSRWDDTKIEKAVFDMWKSAMQNLYNTLKNEIKSNILSDWTTFIEKNNIFESVSEGISGLDFSEAN